MVLSNSGRVGLGVASGTLALIAACAAHAVTIEYPSDRPAALVPCDTARYHGDLVAARRCYAGVLADTDDPRVQAEAARGLGDPKSANAYFQAAVEAYPEDAALRARWAELFRDTHQEGEAVKLYQESLEIDPEHLPAKLGLAKVAAERFEDKARGWLDEVLAAEPRNLGAQVLLARMALEEGNLDEADDRLAAALGEVRAGDYAPLEVYALNASADLLRGVTDSAWTERALEYNPHYGGIYATPAHFYIITRRYREAIELLRRAVEVEPALYEAHAELGINLLRENKVDEAAEHLALAYRGDPFSAPVVNTLRLIDSFDKYRLVDTPPEAGHPELGAGIKLRLRDDEADVLEPYVLDLVERSIATFSERYRFTLKQPVVVELYPEHDDFAVRTSGLPGIGLLGVTFGYLVAMDSPSGRAEGDFHWGTTLWHEMAHVFTLESTSHLVPRWFSEGVSVYEEWSTGPLPGRQIPFHVLQAMKADRFLPVSELDGGFIRPSYENQIMVSYMQAGLTCEYIASRWGQDGLVKMLDEFRAGRDTPAAITQALGISPETFDADFGSYIGEQFGATLDALDEWRAASREAYTAASNEDWAAALEAAQRANALYPEYVGDDSAYLVAAKAHEALGQRDAAIASLAEYHGRGGHSPDTLKTLASWLDGAGRADEARAVLSDVLLVAPLDEELHAELGDWLLRDGSPAAALREYQALAAMNPHDQAAVHYRLARAYHALGEPDRVREHLLYALELAPNYREAQQLLLETVR